MNKLERLQKDVADAEAAYEVAWDTVVAAACAAWSKAKRELNEYLEEQQDND